MKQQLTTFSTLYLLLISVALGSSGDVTNCSGVSLASMEVAYVATSNGMFSVCSLNTQEGVLLRWKGVRVSREQLPHAGALRDYLIYEAGSRPTLSSDPNDPAAWDPPRRWWHKYGKIPYPIRDIDPPLSTTWQKDGRIALGFQGHRRFFAVKVVNAYREATGRKPTDREKHIHEIVPISIPSHRREELEKVGLESSPQSLKYTKPGITGEEIGSGSDRETENSHSPGAEVQDQSR